MKNMKKLFMILCIMAMVAGLAACAGSSKETKAVPAETAENEKNETVKTEADDSAAATEYPVTIQDSNGTEVTFDTEPVKVVSMAPNITEMIYQLGLEDRLIGRTTYCDYPEEVSAVEEVGTLREPNIEKIISMEPDVVIASTHFSEESEKQLTDLGVKVVILYEEKKIDGVYTMIETMGRMFNVNEAATETIQEMESSINETKAAVDGLEAPSVYYVVGFGEYGDYTAGGDTFVGELIALTGGDNIALEVSGWSYTLESIVEADPEIIIISEDMKESFMASEHYCDLTAVKNGNVYGIDANLVERQGARNAEGARILAEIFHPEAFK